MTTFLLILHVLVSLFLIFIVLVQGGKGAELGAAFGAGSSQTLFGGRGAATFLNKITTVVAVVFMVTSLLLALASVRTGSVIQKSIPAAERPKTGVEPPVPGEAPPGMPVQPQGQTPVAPGTPPPAPTGQ
jgi:preprotein translocase subunit SecG